jgi:hypothetical protein
MGTGGVGEVRERLRAHDIAVSAGIRTRAILHKTDEKVVGNRGLSWDVRSKSILKYFKRDPVMGSRVTIAGQEPGRTAADHRGGNIEDDIEAREAAFQGADATFG